MLIAHLPRDAVAVASESPDFGAFVFAWLGAAVSGFEILADILDTVVLGLQLEVLGQDEAFLLFLLAAVFGGERLLVVEVGEVDRALGAVLGTFKCLQLMSTKLPRVAEGLSRAAVQRRQCLSLLLQPHDCLVWTHFQVARSQRLADLRREGRCFEAGPLVRLVGFESVQTLPQTLVDLPELVVLLLAAF